ncbi:hypothetical protein [Brevibacillus centrosporus]|uniref:hypothetical protein n=1 Tax=Brevibacillus centrosporus TaxID=54910 RepID=UPI002E201785|nr:hypothetical protein [Brevibacillus centrosporus]
MSTNRIISDCPNLANTLLVNNSLCPIVSVYYVCSEDELVTDEKEAKQFPEYELASIEDLRDFAALYGQVFKDFLKVIEGLCHYVEVINEDGDLEWGSYELIQEVVTA